MTEKNTKLTDANEGEIASELSALLGRCRTCTHWGNSRNYARDEGERLKSCDCSKHFYGHHFENESVPDNGAEIEDDEGWGMLTGPKFGCVNWVNKAT